MNDRIVSAVFDNRSEAEAAARDLRQAGVPDSALSVIARHDQSGGDFGDANTEEVKDKGSGALKGALAGGGVGALLGIAALAIPGVGPLAAAGAIAGSAIPEAAGIGAGVGALTGGLSGLLAKHGVSEEDAGYYEDRINQGGTFLSVDTGAAGIGAEQIRDILHRNGGHNASNPRSTTTEHSASSTQMAFGGSGETHAETTQSASSESVSSTSGLQRDGFNETRNNAVAEERVPIVEEELRVGTREVERGGAHVHTHVEETPVNEQVTLREENVSIERRPVSDGSAVSQGNSDNLFQDRDIDMRATAEEAVVGKEAHVNEELVVRKTAGEHVENVSDTVRHTEVDVDGDRSALGFDRDNDRR
jgi:uncharacterized protein (TIGR02271 family)